MKNLNIRSHITFFNVLNMLGWPAVLLYFLSMVVMPWVAGNGDWEYVQNVWDRWQGFNVGMLALISSIIALNISYLSTKRLHDRDFHAARAFLPEALSELCTYFSESASFYNKVWDLEEGEELKEKAPRLPSGYKEIFAQCIRHAEPNIGIYLSKILEHLQIHDARIKDFVDNYNDDGYLGPYKVNLLSYYYRIGELQIMIDNIFDFARGRGEFKIVKRQWQDFDHAFGVLKIYNDELTVDGDNLTEFTKRALERNQK